MSVALTEKRLYLTFRISILLKAVHALAEIVGGVLFLVNKMFLVLGVSLLTFGELGEDPKDFLANYLFKSAAELSVSTQHFVAFYLLSHGIVKLVVVVGLLRNKLWAYPASIFVFAAFIFYQVYRFNYTHSPWLLVFTLFDVIIIYLTLHEWNRVHLK